MARIKVEDVYPITTRTYSGTSYSFITSDDLKGYTIPAELDSLYRFLDGQTSYLWGTYPDDVERWLNRNKGVDE